MKNYFILILVIAIVGCTNNDDPVVEPVANSNASPTAVDDTAVTIEDTPVAINILSNDTDSDGEIDPTSVSISSAATNGTTTINSTTGELTYTPNSGYVGADSLIYNVCDDATTAACDTATVSITINPDNSDVTPPCTIVENIVHTQTENSITVSWDPCIDPNGEEVTYVLNLQALAYDCSLNYEYDNGDNFFLTTETTYTFTGLDAIRRYSVSIVAQDPSGNSSSRAWFRAVTLPVGEIDNIYFNSQYYVDLFEGHQITKVLGSVILGQPCWDLGIYTSTRVSDISVLDGIEEIGGDLILESYGWHSFQDISVFQSLSKIGGDLKIIGDGGTNTFIGDISPLSNITELGSLEIRGTAISEIVGFNNIPSLTGDFILNNNAQMTTVNGFNGLQFIGGDIQIGGYGQSGPGLSTITGFSNLETVQNLIIWYNQSLTEINGFNNLISIDNDFQIYDNRNLISINAFSALETVSDVFHLVWTQVENVDFLSSLNHIGNELFIARNDNLENINGLLNLNHLGSLVSISFNPLLEQINFSNFTTGNIFGLRITNNESLISLSGLNNLATIEAFAINENTNLSNITILQNLTTVVNLINIDDNDSLTNLDFLSNLSLIECDSGGSPYDLTITNNFNLADFCGLTLLFTSGGLCSNDYNIQGNGYNPTHIQIINGDCSL